MQEEGKDRESQRMLQKEKDNCSESTKLEF